MQLRWGSGEIEAQLRGLQEEPEYLWVLGAIWTLSVLPWPLDSIWLPQGLACASSCYDQPLPWVLWAGDLTPSSSLTAGSARPSEEMPKWGVWAVSFHVWTEGTEAWTESFDWYKSFEGHSRPFRICKPAGGDANPSVSGCAFPPGKQKQKQRAPAVKDTTGNR